MKFVLHYKYNTTKVALTSFVFLYVLNHPVTKLQNGAIIKQ